MCTLAQCLTEKPKNISPAFLFPLPGVIFELRWFNVQHVEKAMQVFMAQQFTSTLADFSHFSTLCARGVFAV